MEGEKASEPTIGSLANDVPTCYPGELVGDVRTRVSNSGGDMAVVVNQAEVVLGTVGQRALESDPDQRVIDVMDEAPSTYRPDVRPETLLEKMQEDDFESALVTTSEGKLVGLFEKRSIIDLTEERAAENT